MRNIIFYFSATGNGLSLAKSIAQVLPSYELYPIAQAMREDFDYSTLHNIGIITPVYAYGAPKLVESFCRKIKNANYIFGISNYATSPGVSLKRLKAILKKNSLTMQGEFYIKMPENFIPIFPSPTEKIITDCTSNAEEHIKIVTEVVGKEATYAEKNPAKFGMHSFVRVMGSASFGFLDLGFRVSNKCISCNLCSKVCPVKNIDMVDGRPVWKHHCTMCIACLQHCPVDAIDWGFTTQGKKRYHHPSTKSSEFIQR